MSLFRMKKKILIVEDEPDIAESLQARLALENYVVVIAKNGQEGVEQARSEKPDLILLDVMMPILNGYDVCNLLKSDKRTAHIPILVLTALPHVEDAEKAFSAGAADFLNKPYTNERLIQKVQKLLQPK
jgi:two-component system, cell cycle response regulator